MFTALIWVLCWSVLIACSLWFLLRNLLEDASTTALFAMVSILLFFSFDSLSADIAAYLHPFNDAIRSSLHLPFTRMFFPQVSVPALGFYFLHCAQAQKYNFVRNYVWMATLQLFAFLSFPYAAVFMGLATAILLVILIGDLTREQLQRFAAVGLVSLLIDSGWLWLAIRHTASGERFKTVGPVLKLDWFQLRLDFGGTVVVLMAAAIGLLLLRSRAPIAPLVAAMGLANGLMLLADVVVDPHFLVSHHAGYFVHFSLGLEIIVLLWTAAPSLRTFRVLAILLSGCAIGNGVLASLATLRSHAMTNENLSNFAEVIEGLHLGPEDLVVAPATYVDDASTIVPLLTGSHVLYARNAEVLLGANAIQSDRQAVYLFLMGRDAQWVEVQLRQPTITPAVLSLEERFRLEDPRIRSQVAEDARSRLIPRLMALKYDPSIPLLQQPRRLIVLDFAARPIFNSSRIESLLKVSQDFERDGIHVQICRGR